MVSSIAQELHAGNIVSQSPQLLSLVGKLLQQQLVAGFGKDYLTVDYDTPDAEMLQRLTRDVWHFSAAKCYNELRDMTLALRNPDGSLRTFEEFKTAAGAIGDRYNSVWLKTEYNQAVGASTMAARWVEFKKNEKLMPYLRYSTVGDARVRDAHRALDGTVKKLSDAFWATYFPPNGWRCRCSADQLPFSHALETKTVPEVPVSPLFRTNLAQAGLVFPSGHPYYDGVPAAELNKAIAYLPPDAGYRMVNVKSGSVAVHILHSKVNEAGMKELSRHLDVSKNLIELGYTNIKLLPEIHTKDVAAKPRYYPKGYVPINRYKNPDCWMRDNDGNNMVCEFKVIEGTGRNLVQRIEEAAGQAEYAIVKFKSKYSGGAKNLKGRVEKSLNEHSTLRGIIVLDSDGSLLNEILK